MRRRRSFCEKLITMFEQVKATDKISTYRKFLKGTYSNIFDFDPIVKFNASEDFASVESLHLFPLADELRQHAIMKTTVCRTIRNGMKNGVLDESRRPIEDQKRKTWK